MTDAINELQRLPAGTAGFVDHIGIAVRDLEAGIRLYGDLLGLELDRIEEVPQEQVRVAIARFIAKRGPGLHHIALAAQQIETVAERCRAAGLRLLDETPRTGAGGKQIVFVHPQSADGVLIEICAEPSRK